MPSPIDVPASATADENGNATLTQTISASYWTLVGVTAQAAGSGEWVAGVNGQPKLFQGATANAVMKPLLVPPHSQAFVQVTGATPDTPVTADFWGWQGEASDGSDLAALDQTTISAGTIAGVVPIGGTVDIGNTVPVSDGGLAESTVALSTQFAQVHDQPLIAGTTQVFNVGVGGTYPYPSGAAGWELNIVGMAGAGKGVRVQWEGVNTGVVKVRDTAASIEGMIVASGIVDDTQMQFSITVPAGAPATGLNALLYMCGSNLVQDNWYDSAIYGLAYNLSAGTAGNDGGLLRVNSTLGSGANATYALPTYRGPVQLGISVGQAAHGAIYEYDYTGANTSQDMNLNTFSGSGPGRSEQQFDLPGLGNAFVIFNDDASASNTFFLELRAIKDLLS